MFDADFVARFEEKFSKTEGCWNWEASLAGKGYGQMKLPKQRRQMYAHRIAYLIYKGEIQEGKQVCHTCDNPRCVNPDHLFVGSSHDNHVDMVKKDRHLYGRKNAVSKLTEEQVRQIKVCLQIGMTQRQIAAAFDISQIEISRINTGKRWSHVK